MLFLQQIGDQCTRLSVANRGSSVHFIIIV